MGALGPMPWIGPSTDEFVLKPGWVDAGDWLQVFLSFRQGSTPMGLGGGFLAHVLYRPGADDSTTHPDQPTAFGGGPQGTAKFRTTYRIDPGWPFQAPWRGQVWIVASVDNPASCIVDIVLKKGFAPRIPPPNDHLVTSSPLWLDPLAILEEIDNPALTQRIAPRGQRIWAPPVVRPPVLVPATYLNIEPGTPVPFADATVQIVAVDSTAVPASPIQFGVATMGQNIDLWAFSGIPRDVAQIAQGGACTDGTPATWTPRVFLSSVTAWQGLGC